MRLRGKVLGLRHLRIALDSLRGRCLGGSKADLGECGKQLLLIEVVQLQIPEAYLALQRLQQGLVLTLLLSRLQGRLRSLRYVEHLMYSLGA